MLSTINEYDELLINKTSQYLIHCILLSNFVVYKGLTSKISSLIDNNLLLESLQGSQLNIHFSMLFLSKVFYEKKLYYTLRNAKKCRRRK